MQRIDAKTLTTLISTCFDLSMDGRLTTTQRDRIHRAGIRLRGDLVAALSAQFNDGTAAVLNVNNELKTVAEDVESLKNDLSRIDSIVTKISVLSGALDEMLNIAVGFN